MLPQDSKLILFGSVKIMDTRKGVDYMIKACKLLAEKYPELKEQLGVVVFGNQSQQIQNMLPFKVYPLAFVSNEHQLVDIYNSVDLFVTPSLEENLPNMIMEAMSCGIPCVGFNVGGIPEMIDHLHNAMWHNINRLKTSPTASTGYSPNRNTPPSPNKPAGKLFPIIRNAPLPRDTLTFTTK
mgnify:CR=1 FL=1